MEDDDDELYPLDLPESMNPLSYIISQFFIEVDRKEKKVYREVSSALEEIYERYGQPAGIAAVNYVARREGWDFEILLEKYEVENHLLNKYNTFDDNIWKKVLGTAAMSDYRRKVFEISQTYLDRAVREVLEKERPDTSQAGDPLL